MNASKESRTTEIGVGDIVWRSIDEVEVKIRMGLVMAGGNGGQG
jgi:hypothetical protein